jgi:hypothetical protein
MNEINIGTIFKLKNYGKKEITVIDINDSYGDFRYKCSDGFDTYFFADRNFDYYRESNMLTIIN